MSTTNTVFAPPFPTVGLGAGVDRGGGAVR